MAPNRRSSAHSAQKRRPAASAQDRGSSGQPAGWALRCAPGLAKLLIQELRFRKAVGKSERVAVLRQRNHDLLFLSALRDPAQLPRLRIAEECHHCLAYGRYKISDRQLDRVAQRLAAGRRSGRRLVVTADGSHFDRRDLARWVGRQLAARGVPLSDRAGRPLWLFCIDQAYYLCEPAFAGPGGGRPSRAVEREGALPPTVAAAMAFAGKPAPGETVLDPVCGSATLLAEAAGYQPGCRLIGLDLDRKAVKAARANLAKTDSATIRQGDGAATELAAGSVDLVLANLPFGKLYGDRLSNPELYRSLLEEIRRVGRPGAWRAVLLSADRDALDAALAAGQGLGRRPLFTVKVRGETALAVLVTPAAR